ncbi:probable receptor-like protein kinase at1g11050 [Phtheirospermum japonicum]|uniref:non-specific serine/threonine protein kinase n=1 Tax=Phtheirospermum japonicum TaxID=374723 RepID=A0A830BQ93_9LAMI|nr:probable receptor-like protein kinase at1g11050 [Phtheirospermum japonicum]
MNSHFIFFIFIYTISCTNQASSISSYDSSSCPINFDYIETFPWDNSLCHSPTQSGCCQTLRSLFGIGLANHLKQTSMFYLPDPNTSSSCITNFQNKLATTMSISNSLFPVCFNDTTEFVNRPSTSCAGIMTIHDWTQKEFTHYIPLETSCNGDLTGLTRCSLCLDAGLKVNSYLVSLHPNSTKCFFFAILYAAAIVNDFGPEDVRTASCILALPISRSANGGKTNDIKRKLVFGSVGGFLGVVFVIGLFLFYKKWDVKGKRDLIMHEKYVSNVRSRVLPNTGAKWFSIEELEQATSGFSGENMIGQGGFGVVYKGTLLDGTEVAVKQILDSEYTKGDDDFTNEAEIISKIRHRNLLPLRGFCVTSERFKGNRRYLVYDYMSNGNLDDHIFVGDGINNRPHLSWPQRKNVILDIAKGLAYLHYGVKPAIYHRDIKATNILLDSDMKARVADFGLAKQSAEGQSHLTTRVAGTHGYLAPEYALYGQLTEKSDVYSFGIVILEIMSGRRALDASEPSSKILITDWAWTKVRAGKVDEVFHESMRNGGGPKGVMERFVRVGILCAHVMVALRPTIADALKMLEGDIDIPRLPDRPSPFSHEMLGMSVNYSTFTSDGSRDKSKISSL